MEDEDCDFETLSALLEAEETGEAFQDSRDEITNNDGDVSDSELDALAEMMSQENEPDGGEQKEEAPQIDDELKILYSRIAELEAKKRGTIEVKKEPEEVQDTPGQLREAPKNFFEEPTPDDPPKVAPSKPEKAFDSTQHDSDSDWEDLEGMKPSHLSEAGKELDSLINKNSCSRIAHRSDIKPLSPKRKNVKKEFQEPVPSTSFSNQSSYTLSAPSGSSRESKFKEIKDSYYETEHFTSIRIKNPLVSSQSIKSLMAGRNFISVSNVQKGSRASKLEGDWATIGVIVNKSDVRKSSKDGNHSRSDDVAIMVDVDQKVMQIGQSKDFAFCKAKTKAGNNCSQFVNLQQGPFCQYHVKKEYKKKSANRAELQSGYSGIQPGGERSFVKTVFKNSSTSYSYGGQSFCSGSSGKAVKRPTQTITLEKLQKHCQRTVKDHKGITTLSMQNLLPETSSPSSANPKKDESADSAENDVFLDRLCNPTPGSMQFVKYLQKKEQQKVTATNKKKNVQSVTASQVLKIFARDMAEKKQKAAKEDGTPCLGRGLTPGQDFDLDAPTPKIMSPMEKAKLKAIQKLKESGGLQKPDPNAVKTVKRKSETVEEFENDTSKVGAALSQNEKSLGSPRKKKSRLLSDLNLDPEEMQKLMSAKSAHDNGLSQEEEEKMEEYFNAMEKTEQMETKMAGITQIKCTAVYCRKCKYHAFGASKHCKEDHREALKYYSATKRFFACADCGKHSASLERYPKESCSQCGGSSFKSASMMKEKKGPKLPSQELVLRGEETKFLNSLK